jgi:hypothetical protein
MGRAFARVRDRAVAVQCSAERPRDLQSKKAENRGESDVDPPSDHARGSFRHC